MASGATMLPQAAAVDVQTAAERLARRRFVGGPPGSFEHDGRMQLVALLRAGMKPSSRVLDVGCGALRGGYWLIHFLDPGCYHGIEPNREMLAEGIRTFLEPGLLARAEPSFSHNDDWDFSVFGVDFDFVMARSIWSHAAKPQIAAMLDSFSATAAPGGVMLASYHRARLVGSRRDYRGAAWRGRSHESDSKGDVAHSFRWIQKQCALRGLTVREPHRAEFRHQRWLRIARA